MVPGSTLRYGSSFWRETLRCRAFRMFPIEAAVMPLPREETTPPVTKTYFDMDDLQGGFMDFTGNRGGQPIPRSGRAWRDLVSPPGAARRADLPHGGGALLSGLCFWLQHYDLRFPFRG